MALTKQSHKPAVKQSFESNNTETNTTNQTTTDPRQQRPVGGKAANEANSQAIKVNSRHGIELQHQTDSYSSSTPAAATNNKLPQNNHDQQQQLHQRLSASQRRGADESRSPAVRAGLQQTGESVKEAEGPERGQQQQQQNDQKQPAAVAAAADEISLAKKLTIDCLMCLIKAVIFLYSLISLPICYFKHQVYRKQHEVDQVERSRQLDPTDPSSPWTQTNIEPLHAEISAKIDSFETYDEMMRRSFEDHAELPCYGFREVLEERMVKRPDSEKLLRQVRLSDYKWVTYGQFNRQIEAARKGFLLEGVRPGDKVMLYADTRPEWQVASQALIRLGAIVGTMYSTLGVDGIVHSVNETQVTHVVTQRDKVNKLLRLKPKLPHLAKIIYFEPRLELRPEIMDGAQVITGAESGGLRAKLEELPEFEHKEVECLRFGRLLVRGLLAGDQDIEELESRRGNGVDLLLTPEGDSAAAAAQQQQRQAGPLRRSKDSIAVIMYTSGSTGIPKGVLISHRNIMATLKSFSYVTKDFVHKPRENVCTAYLPLAHIFEFCIESVMLYHGVRYGFATPHTLTDKSPGLMAGQLGDLTLLKPTVMIIVPLILDRVMQGVRQALKASGSYFKEQLVSYLIDYKIGWMRRHYETPLVDRIVCSKVSSALGGRAKYVICGSAPLSGETQSFVRAAFNLKLPQGFGTTETCAATACQLFDDQSTCNVGLPVAGCQIKLEPWLEGNYRPTDKPHPRGEIVVGGEMIAHGYFNLDEQTREAFYVDERGTRWYRTGDIGEFLPNGNLKIIDRKKDLVKLQNGEYVSLGKVESTLKSNPYTDNFCVYANSAHNYVVALGPANELAIKTLAQQLVDEFERNSPSLAAKHHDHRAALRMSEREQQVAIEQLREVLALYEQDQLNNNNEEQLERERQLERKMSSLSTSSTAAGGINERLKLLCDNRLVQQRVLASIWQLAQERELMSLEVPRKLLLLAEEWTEDKNLVTAAMKIRRNFIYKRYEQELAQVYASG